MFCIGLDTTNGFANDTYYTESQALKLLFIYKMNYVFKWSFTAIRPSDPKIHLQLFLDGSR